MFSVVLSADECQTVPVHIGDAVRMVRKNAELTQEELAAKAGISPTTLVRLETGRNYERSTLQKVARALKTSEGEIYAILSEHNRGVRREILKQMGSDPAIPKSSTEESPLLYTDVAPGHETLTELGKVMGFDLSNPAVREALAAFERLTPEQQDKAIDYMRDLRLGRGVSHRQPGKRRA